MTDGQSERGAGGGDPGEDGGTGGTDREAAALRRYRLLLRAFPQHVRARFGPEMEETFLRLLEREGGASRLRRMGVWVRAAWDAVRTGWGMRLGRAGSWSGGGNGRGDRTLSGRRGRRREAELVASLFMDIRLAARGLARRPLFTLTAALTLALGIGANTAIFSVVNGLLLRPLPYPEPDRLVVLWAENAERGWFDTDVNIADAWEWRARSGVLEDLAVHVERDMALTGLDEPRMTGAIETTTNLFDVLQVEPVRGRAFTADDGREGAPLAVVLSHGFWDRAFGRDPDVVGRTLRLEGEAATVVGIMSPDFVFLDELPDLFVPYRGDPLAARRGSHDREAVARLAAGVDLGAARQALRDVAALQAAEHPEQNAGWSVDVVELRTEMLGDMAGRAALVLMGAVGFVLLMACTNVGNLLLVRANGRRGEMAVRTALGAGRSRIVRQLLAESAVLAALGCLVGLALGWVGEKAVVAALPPEMPPVFEYGLDGTVMAFAVGVTGLSILLFGLVPAARGSVPAAGDLREEGRSGSGGRRARRTGAFLVVVQTALAVVLLVGAGIMFRSVAGMASRDLGFESEGVLTLRISPPPDRVPEAEGVEAWWDRVLEQARAVPGVEVAGAVHALPLGGANWAGSFWIEGEEDPMADEGRPTRLDYISPGYLEAMGLEVVAGRGLEESDRDGPPAALVSRTFVEDRLQGRDPLGLRILTSGLQQPATVVGVVEDHVQRAIDRQPEATLILPLDRRQLRARTLVIRTSGEPEGLVDAVKAAVWTVDPDVPLYEVQTMESLVRRRLGGFLVIAQLMGAFGLISLLLGAVGIYGVTAHAVGRRTGEIGIRMAMGADRRRVMGMVLREGAARVLGGLALGLGLALLLSRVMEGLVVDVSTTDPATFLGVAAVLLLVAFLGTWIPARRASSVDPADALRAG